MLLSFKYKYNVIAMAKPNSILSLVGFTFFLLFILAIIIIINCYNISHKVRNLFLILQTIIVVFLKYYITISEEAVDPHPPAYCLQFFHRLNLPDYSTKLLAKF